MAEYRLAWALLALSLLAPVTEASASVVHPTDTSAVIVDSFHVSVRLRLANGSPTADFDLSVASGGTEVTETIFVFATAGGRQLVGDPSTIVGTRHDTSYVPSPARVFDALSAAAVQYALAYGMIAGLQPGTSVFQPMWVEETVVHRSITFTTCGGSQHAQRGYSINWSYPVSSTLTSGDACNPQYTTATCRCTVDP